MSRTNKSIIVILLICIIGVFCSCDFLNEVEYTAINNTNISNVLNELKNNYSLADCKENKIILKGTKSRSSNLIYDEWLTLELYIDSDDWNVGCDAARYVLKRISAMCSDDTITTINCIIYLNQDGYYVPHSMNTLYNENQPNDLYLSITDFDSDNLKQDYIFFKKQYNLEDHNTRKYNNIKYIDPIFEIKFGSNGYWCCSADLRFNEGYSVDELISIGKKAYAYLAVEAAVVSATMEDFETDKNYSICVYEESFYVKGENRDDSTNLVWECIEIS